MRKIFPKLFSPVRIGGLEIKNRVAMTAMGVSLAAAGGGVSDDIIAFYEARARGSLGLIISEICRVMDGAGAGEPCQLAARNGADVPGLGRLVDAVHKYGARMFIQLHHPGRQGSVLVCGEQPVSASAVANPHTGEAPRPLTLPEIGKIQEAFVNGARLAQMAGANFLDISCAIPDSPRFTVCIEPGTIEQGWKKYMAAVGILPWGAGRQPRPPQHADSNPAGQGGKRP